MDELELNLDLTPSEAEMELMFLFYEREDLYREVDRYMEPAN